MTKVLSIAEKIHQQDKRALARGITLVENRSDGYLDLIKYTYSLANPSHIVGITGPPGSGKSSLITNLIKLYREQDKTIAILAIDPTSPFTGGAILGDRIRMLDHSVDKGVYIRSMASRGQLGGMSKAAFDSVNLMQAFGFDVIIIETVGAGQNEIDIFHHCDTVVVIAVPELGDDIQIIKAGVNEIPNIFVVNKSDKKGATQLALQIEDLLNTKNNDWIVPVIKTSCTNNTGIQDLFDQLSKHDKYLEEHGLIEKIRKRRIEHEVMSQIQFMISEGISKSDIKSKLINQIYNNQETSPHEVAEQLLQSYLRNIDNKG